MPDPQRYYDEGFAEGKRVARMTETERAVLEAAFGLAFWQQGLDLGVPTQPWREQAYKALIAAVDAHAAENEGRMWVVSDDSA